MEALDRLAKAGRSRASGIRMKEENAYMFAALQALLNTCAVSFDLPILEWIQAHLQCGFLDKAMPIVTLSVCSKNSGQISAASDARVNSGA